MKFVFFFGWEKNVECGGKKDLLGGLYGGGEGLDVGWGGFLEGGR